MRLTTAISVIAAQSILILPFIAHSKRLGEEDVHHDDDDDDDANQRMLLDQHPSSSSSSSSVMKKKQPVEKKQFLSRDNTKRGHVLNALHSISRDDAEKPTMECDPNHDVVINDADIGVLACGVTEYCAESSLSSLGGYCVEEDTKNEIMMEGASLSVSSKRRLLRNSENRRHNRHRLAATSSPLTVDSLMESFCHPGNDSSSTSCTCSHADASEQTLVVSCLEPSHCYDYVNKCDHNIYNCLTYHYILALRGNKRNIRRRIYEQTHPYYERIVYTGITAPHSAKIVGCVVEFNGVKCQSCRVKPQLIHNDDDMSLRPVLWPCYEFDCTNTDGQHFGNSCNLDATKVFDYVTYHGCPVCDICERVGGFMALMTETVDFSGTLYGCGELNGLGSGGFLNAAECQVAQNHGSSVCGCN